MDIGLHNCVGRALLMHVSAEENIRRSLQISIDGMNKCLSNLDSRADKQRFLEANHTAFMIPKKFDAASYQNKIEEVCSYRIFFLILFRLQFFLVFRL